MCRGAAVDVGLGDGGEVVAPVAAVAPGWEAVPCCWPPCCRPPCCRFTVCHSTTAAVMTSAATTIPTIQRPRAFLPAGCPGVPVAALMGVPRAHSAAQSWSPRQRYYARRRTRQEQRERERERERERQQAAPAGRAVLGLERREAS